MHPGPHLPWPGFEHRHDVVHAGGSHHPLHLRSVDLLFHSHRVEGREHRYWLVGPPCHQHMGVSFRGRCQAIEADELLDEPEAVGVGENVARVRSQDSDIELEVAGPVLLVGRHHAQHLRGHGRVPHASNEGWRVHSQHPASTVPRLPLLQRGEGFQAFGAHGVRHDGDDVVR